MTARIEYIDTICMEIARINSLILIKRGFETNCHAYHIIEIKIISEIHSYRKK